MARDRVTTRPNAYPEAAVTAKPSRMAAFSRPMALTPIHRSGVSGTATPMSGSEYASVPRSGWKMLASNMRLGRESACCTQSIVHAWNRGSNGSWAVCPIRAASGHVVTIAIAMPAAVANASSTARERRAVTA